MSSASWKNQASLSQLAPTALTSAISGLNTVLTTATSIVRTIENVVRTASNFITSPGDVLSAFLSNYSSALFKVITDTLSLGGGFIFIHPYNRINRRVVNILPIPASTASGKDQIIYPMNLPVMTPQEALNEFYASFGNTADPFRPQWTDNVEVTGFGLLFVAPDPTGLVTVMRAFEQVVNFKEVVDVQRRYSADIQSWYDNTISMVGPDFSHFLNFDITGLNIKTVTKTTPDGTSTTEVTQVFDNTVPSLHWYGLNLSNFTFLKNLEKLAKDLVNSLLKLIQTTSNFIKEMGDALIRRLETLLNLVTTIIQVAEGFLVSLNSTGVYYFSVPKNFGGVAYLQNAIQTSLTSPQNADAQQVASVLNVSQFSALFFAGAGTGVNLKNWEALFKHAFDDTNFKFNSTFNAQFSVLPDFNNTVFQFGQRINLRVVSQDSTPSHQLYYTYEIKDDRGETVSSQLNRLTPNDAKVNTDVFSIVLSSPPGHKLPVGTLNYSITVTVFDQGANNKNYTKNFFVTDSVSGVNTRIGIDKPVTITVGECGGTMAILNNNAPTGGQPVENALVAPNTTASLGTTISPDSDNLSVQYTSSCDDNTSFTIPVVNNTGFRVVDVDKLPLAPSYRFLTYPAKMCINIPGSFKYRVLGTSNWSTVTLPACFTLENETCYEYYIFTEEQGWQGPLGFCVVQQATEGTQVC